MLFAAAELSNLWPARMQMAFTLGFHIVLACFGVGLPILMLVAEWRALRRQDSTSGLLARRWSKAFAVLFAIGAVSGTVLSFELGLLWPEFMGRFGAVIGLPFTMEGFAFFLEAIFVGIYLYGWQRLPPRLHWWTGVPVAVAGLMSAAFVVTANAWMNCPQGFRLEGDAVVDVNPLAAMLNPASASQVVHMVLAAYMVTGFCVAAFYATLLWLDSGAADAGSAKGNYASQGMALGLWLAAVTTPLQLVSGDWCAKVVARTQPAKLAAMEGQYTTERGAPMRVLGWPDDEQQVTRYSLEIPKLLSWIAYGDADAEVKGLEAFPRADWPPTAVVHGAFQLMVGCGLMLFLIVVWSMVTRIKKGRFPSSRWFLASVMASGPMSVLALESGWVVTEVGRQPWIVQGVMRTREAITESPGVWYVFYATLAIYALLAAVTVIVLRLSARVPLGELPRPPADGAPTRRGREEDDGS